MKSLVATVGLFLVMWMIVSFYDAWVGIPWPGTMSVAEGHDLLIMVLTILVVNLSNLMSRSAP